MTTNNQSHGEEDQQQDPPKSNTKVPTTTVLYAAGICCPMEVPLIEAVLVPLPGVDHVEVTVMLKTVTVRHDAAQVPPAALMAALNAVHMQASLYNAQQGPRTSRTQSILDYIPPWHLLVASFCILLSLLSLLDGPLDAPWLHYAEYIALGSPLLTGPLLARKAFAALRNKLLDINLLTLLAIAGAIAMGMYQEAGAVAVLLPLAEWLEDRCSANARAALASAAGMRATTAVLADTGEHVEVDTITTDTLILVRPGDVCAVDGTVVRGRSQVDESLLTGEARGVDKSVGSVVYGGTVNCGRGALTVRCDAPANASAAARVAALVQRAAGTGSHAERVVTRFAMWYTPVVVVVSLLLAGIPVVVLRGLVQAKEWIYLSLQVLVTACPCALVLATPATVVSALAAAARAGVVVKGGEVFERLAGVRVVTLDKTGTVTMGGFKVHSFTPVNNATKTTTILRMVAAVESSATHPIAATIVGYAAAQGASARGLIVRNARTYAGMGVEADVDDPGSPPEQQGSRRVAVGNARMMQRVGVTAERNQAAVMLGTIAYVAIDKTLQGWFVLGDALRPSALPTILRLQNNLHVACMLLTGDRVGVDQAELHFTETHTSLLPEDKLRYVEEYQHTIGPVAHVGDGINDAPALAAASVGLAMGNVGAALAVDAADVALFGRGELAAVPGVVALGRAVRRKIWENIIVSVVLKVVVVVLAALKMGSLWLAVAVDAGTAVLVILNGMWLLRYVVVDEGDGGDAGWWVGVKQRVGGWRLRHGRGARYARLEDVNVVDGGDVEMGGGTKGCCGDDGHTAHKGGCCDHDDGGHAAHSCCEHDDHQHHHHDGHAAHKGGCCEDDDHHHHPDGHTAPAACCDHDHHHHHHHDGHTAPTRHGCYHHDHHHHHHHDGHTAHQDSRYDHYHHHAAPVAHLAQKDSCCDHDHDHHHHHHQHHHHPAPASHGCCDHDHHHHDNHHVHNLAHFGTHGRNHVPQLL